MKNFLLLIIRIKAAYLLLLVPLVLMACDNSSHVFLKNFTNDNISINWQGLHVKKGGIAAVAILTEEHQTESFEICRSYGCLATMTITATEIPEEVDPLRPAGITLYEKTRNKFSFDHKGPISVSVENHDIVYPGQSSEDASDFDITESDVIYDE